MFAYIKSSYKSKDIMHKQCYENEYQFKITLILVIDIDNTNQNMLLT